MSFICKICIKQNISAVFNEENNYLKHLKNKHNIVLTKDEYTLLQMGDY
jgi:hypothetical protein